jgi:hypothetical protein
VVGTQVRPILKKAGLHRSSLHTEKGVHAFIESLKENEVAKNSLIAAANGYADAGRADNAIALLNHPAGPNARVRALTLERRRQEEGMIIALYIAAAVTMAVGSLYFAWRNRDFRKFLAGAFFVSSGILFYLYLADVSVPLLGTSFVETPQISGGRAIVHFMLFLLCFYFGFIRKPKD